MSGSGTYRFRLLGDAMKEWKSKQNPPSNKGTSAESESGESEMASSMIAQPISAESEIARSTGSWSEWTLSEIADAMFPESVLEMADSEMDELEMERVRFGMDTSNGVFGMPLAGSIKYANVAIRLFDGEHHPIDGYIPIVIDECGSFLTKTLAGKSQFQFTNGNEVRVNRLVKAFDSQPNYGKGLTWESLDDASDAAAVFFRYLTDLPEPVIPCADFEWFLQPLQPYQDTMQTGLSAICKGTARYDIQQHISEQYVGLINSLELPNRLLLLYVLNMISVFPANSHFGHSDLTTQSDTDSSWSNNLATILRPALLSPPLLKELLYGDLLELAHYVILFLINHRFTFVLGLGRNGLIKGLSYGNMRLPKDPKPEPLMDPSLVLQDDNYDPGISQFRSRPSTNLTANPDHPHSLVPQERPELQISPDMNVKAENPEAREKNTSTSAGISLTTDRDITLKPTRKGPIAPLQSTDDKTKSQPDQVAAISEIQTMDSIFQLHQERAHVFTEEEISTIAQVLRGTSPSHSVMPRIYIILRVIGCLDNYKTILKTGFSDYELPVSHRDVPKHLSSEARSQFLVTQTLVCTKNADLELGAAGQHHHFDAGDPLPFEIRERLGDGGFGQVDRIISLRTGKEFALKRFARRAVSSGKGLAGLRGIIAEIEIMKTLTHRHVVRFVGSYTDQKFLGLLMTPIAELDFFDYLAHANPVQHSSIRSFFGCLTAGLEYLHAQKVRHKDIKPGNILVSQGSVLLTDFGLAREFGDATGSTSVGTVNGTSPRYAAPEVLMMESRNTKSDIWSLGIVFLEMIIVLKNRNNEWLDEFMSSHGFENKFVRNNRPGFQELVVELQKAGPQADNIALGWVESMLNEQHIQRPSAAELLDKIMYCGEDRVPNGRFCGLCCRDEESDSSDNSD